MLVNLEQVRAKNAIRLALGKSLSGAKGGELVKKLPPLIMNHGLLACLAYALEAKDDSKELYAGLARHLADKNIAIIAPCNSEDSDSCYKHLTKQLLEGDSAKLQRATSEAMAWLSYLRRYANKIK